MKVFVIDETHLGGPKPKAARKHLDAAADSLGLDRPAAWTPDTDMRPEDLAIVHNSDRARLGLSRDVITAPSGPSVLRISGEVPSRISDENLDRVELLFAPIDDPGLRNDGVWREILSYFRARPTSPGAERPALLKEPSASEKLGLVFLLKALQLVTGAQPNEAGMTDEHEASLVSNARLRWAALPDEARQEYVSLLNDLASTVGGTEANDARQLIASLRGPARG